MLAGQMTSMKAPSVRNGWTIYVPSKNILFQNGDWTVSAVLSQHAKPIIKGGLEI